MKYTLEELFEKGTIEAAIEAGKILSKEILKNTTFSRVSYHNALIFGFSVKNIVSMNFYSSKLLRIFVSLY